MEELGKHYAKLKKLGTEDHILYDSVYMKYPEMANLSRQSKFVADKTSEGCDCHWIQHFSKRVMKIILELDSDGYTVL